MAAPEEKDLDDSVDSYDDFLASIDPRVDLALLGPGTEMGPGFSREQPSAEIDALADHLEQDTGCTIDRDLFRNVMIDFSQHYRCYRANNTSRSPQEIAATKRAHRRCQALQAALQETNYQVALDEINRLELALRWAVDNTKRDPSEKARYTKAALFRESVYYLAFLYQHNTGRPAGTSTSLTSDDRAGPFVRFVASVLKVMEPDTRRAGLGESIAKLLPLLKDHMRYPFRTTYVNSVAQAMLSSNFSLKYHTGRWKPPPE